LDNKVFDITGARCNHEINYMSIWWKPTSWRNSRINPYTVINFSGRNIRTVSRKIMLKHWLVFVFI